MVGLLLPVVVVLFELVVVVLLDAVVVLLFELVAVLVVLFDAVVLLEAVVLPLFATTVVLLFDATVLLLATVLYEPKLKLSVFVMVVLVVLLVVVVVLVLVLLNELLTVAPFHAAVRVEPTVPEPEDAGVSQLGPAAASVFSLTLPAVIAWCVVLVESESALATSDLTKDLIKTAENTIAATSVTKNTNAASIICF